MASPPPPFPPGPGGPQIIGPGGGPLQPGQRPTPEQIQAVQRKIAEDAQKAGMSVPEFLETLKKQAQERAMHMRRMQAQQQQQGGMGAGMAEGPPGPNGRPLQPGQQVRGPPPGAVMRQPITAGPPKPEALALAKFLKGQDLKPRTCILNGERKDMFKGEALFPEPAFGGGRPIC